MLDAVPTTAGATHGLTVPTVLDSKLGEMFHPAPLELDYGRTIDLRHDEECERMTTEVLHLRFDYTPAHLWAVDAIVTRPPVAPPLPDGAGGTRLEKPRETHLFCLQYCSGRDDFCLPATGTSP